MIMPVRIVVERSARGMLLSPPTRAVDRDVSHGAPCLHRKFFFAARSVKQPSPSMNTATENLSSDEWFGETVANAAVARSDRRRNNPPRRDVESARGNARSENIDRKSTRLNSSHL